MSLQFYFNITEDERKIFKIKEQTLKSAAKDVTSAYSQKSLMEGSTFLDYNNPRNRCAYLYKYAAIHTGLVCKYFTTMLGLMPLKIVLDNKKDINICCLGGGPGTDIVGIVQALAAFPCLHQKVSQVTVLDLCGGWRNSFNHIISRLKHGKVEGVPSSFIDSSKFKADLIAVNLLEPLPLSVVKVISSADIVCMVKFVSAIIGKKESVSSLKVIANHIKIGASVVFIDNVCDKVSGPVEQISLQCGLTSVLGPMHGTYKYTSTKTKQDIYGCLPCCKIRVSVIGWIKTISLQNDSNHSENITVTVDSIEDDSWNTESDNDDVILPNMVLKDSKIQTNKTLSFSKAICNKFTQTNEKYFRISSGNTDDDEISDLCAFLDTVHDLLTVMENFKMFKDGKHCFQRNSHCQYTCCV